MKLYKWLKHLTMPTMVMLSGLLCFLFGIVPTVLFCMGIAAGSIVIPMITDYVDEKEAEDYEQNQNP